jgi:hypothetical protein
MAFVCRVDSNMTKLVRQDANSRMLDDEICIMRPLFSLTSAASGTPAGNPDAELIDTVGAPRPRLCS